MLQPQGIDFSDHKLGLYRQVHLTLTVLRKNVSQMLVADMHGISQPTVSRIYRRMVPLVPQMLAFTGISLEHALEDGHLVLVDGTFGTAARMGDTLTCSCGSPAGEGGSYCSFP